MELSFTNVSGTPFVLLSSADVTLPLASWTELGLVPEISPGQFHFTDQLNTNTSARYYRVRSP